MELVFMRIRYEGFDDLYAIRDLSKRLLSKVAFNEVSHVNQVLYIVSSHLAFHLISAKMLSDNGPR